MASSGESNNFDADLDGLPEDVSGWSVPSRFGG